MSSSMNIQNKYSKLIPNSDAFAQMANHEKLGEIYEYWVPFGELRETWLRAMDNDASEVMFESSNISHLNRQMTETRRGDSFYGTNAKDMKEYLTFGYTIPGLRDLAADYRPVRKRRKMKFSEEGEYQFDLCESGFDWPFLDFTKREAVPGMSVQINLCFVWMTDSRTINEYLVWCLRALYALEASGVDCDVDIVITLRNSIYSYGGISQTNIRVKNEGELSDYMVWSAMLAPGSFRTLGFTAIIMGADFAGYAAHGSLGYDPGCLKDWGVQFERDQSRKLVIMCPYMANNKPFPREKMDDELHAALVEATK